MYCFYGMGERECGEGRMDKREIEREREVQRKEKSDREREGERERENERWSVDKYTSSNRASDCI